MAAHTGVQRYNGRYLYNYIIILINSLKCMYICTIFIYMIAESVGPMCGCSIAACLWSCISWWETKPGSVAHIATSTSHTSLWTLTDSNYLLAVVHDSIFSTYLNLVLKWLYSSSQTMYWQWHWPPALCSEVCWLLEKLFHHPGDQLYQYPKIVYVQEIQWIAKQRKWKIIKIYYII